MVQTAMANEDFDPRVNEKGDDSLLVKFEIKPLQDFTATEQEGRPIFRDVEYISIRVPGSNDEVSRPATQMDKQRFPRHYAAFKQRVSDEEYHEGTLISEWPLVTRAQVEELAFLGVKTVEQLAGMTDHNTQGAVGLITLKQKAIDWLEQQEDISELREKLRKRDEELDALSGIVNELKAQVAELSDTKSEAKAAPKKKVARKKVTAKKE